MQFVSKVGYALLTLTITLLVTDLVLHGMARLVPRVDQVSSFLSAKMPDKQFGYRPNPGYPEHDSNGFRNPVVPDKAHVVALGDSHTYGSGIKSEQSWPRTLGGLTGQTVYNMGLGGYGPVHSLMLWDEAMAFKPRIVIEAIYSGNDLYDAFSMVYRRGNFPHLLSEDDNLRAELQAIVQTQSNAAKGTRLRLAIKDWFIDNSRIVGLLRRAQYELSLARKARLEPEQEWQNALAYANKNGDFAQVFLSPNSRTVFTSQRRLGVLDLDNRIVQEGVRIAHKALAEMQDLAVRDEVHFVVLLIPTKEFVFSVQAGQIESSHYQRLVSNEAQFWEMTRTFLQKNNIEYIDPIPSLKADLVAGNQPYKITHDGHPNARGHQTIATVVYNHLKKNLN